MNAILLLLLAACAAFAVGKGGTAEGFQGPAMRVSEFGDSVLASFPPANLDGRDGESLPTMYPLVPGFTGTNRPKATRMRFVGPGGKPCDCPLGSKEDSVCLYSDGQAFTNECVAQCYNHAPRDYYRCKVKIPLFRKLN